VKTRIEMNTCLQPREWCVRTVTADNHLSLQQPGGIGARKERIEGNPDPKHVSTSYAERQNLTMRMQMRRFTRLTNAFSKKFENHMHMVALYTVWYNYVKQHKSLKGLSPAIAGGISDTLWSATDLRRW
jgi:hypothetical protein